MTAGTWSRFDTTTGFVHYNVPATSIPEARDLFAAARRRRGDSPEDRVTSMELVRAWVRINHFPLLAHEWAHLLQALTHPAVLHRCLREFSLVMTFLEGVRDADLPLVLPLVPPEIWRDELNWGTQRLRLSLDPDGEAALDEAHAKWPRPNDLCEVDLLEDSASIFQYKAEIGGPGSARLYRRWLGERGEVRYSRTFNFLASVLGEEDSFVALPALVLGANSTNWPLASFISLVAATRAHGVVPAQLGVDRYWDFVTTFLGLKVPHGMPRHPREQMCGEDPLIRMDRAAMLKMVDDLPVHPLGAIVREAWVDDAAAVRLHTVLLHPYDAFDRRARDVVPWMRRFEAPITFFHLVEDGGDAGEQVLAISALLAEQEPPGSAESWLSYLMEVLRVRNFVFAAAVRPDPSRPHVCPHVGCRYHAVGICNDWTHVPERPDRCRFPGWLRNSCLRSFDFERGALVRASERE